MSDISSLKTGESAVGSDKFSKIYSDELHHESADIAALKKKLNKKLNEYYVGHVVDAVPRSNVRKMPVRKAVISEAYDNDGHIIFGFDWYKKDGSGDFHDYGPVWARTLLPMSSIVKFHNQIAKTRVQIFQENRAIKARKIND